jgi:hypothetical protein
MVGLNAAKDVRKMRLIEANRSVTTSKTCVSTRSSHRVVITSGVNSPQGNYDTLLRIEVSKYKRYHLELASFGDRWYAESPNYYQANRTDVSIYTLMSATLKDPPRQ